MCLTQVTRRGRNKHKKTSPTEMTMGMDGLLLKKNTKIFNKQ
jgi:hypothetical protein